MDLRVVILLLSGWTTSLARMLDMESLMDSTVDPCTDFYRFACGNFTKTVKLPDNDADVSISAIAHAGTHVHLRELLESPPQPGDTESALLAKRYYRSCMDERAIEKAGFKPLLKILSYYGGWPIIEGRNWTEKGCDWIVTNAKLLRDFTLSPVIRLAVDPDVMNGSKQIVAIGQPELLLKHRDYYLEKSHSDAVEALKKLLLGIAVQLGAPEKAAKSEIDDVIKFETDLANISLKEARRNVNEIHERMTIAELKRTLPALHLEKWFSTVAQSGLDLDDTDLIDVTTMPYLKQVEKLIQTVPARTLANYQIWSIISHFQTYLPWSLRKAFQDYSHTLTGTSDSSKPQRWIECINDAKNMIRYPLSAMYVKKHFPVTSKNEVEAMANNVKEILRITIDQADWMDQKTKAKAQEKLKEMKQKIGFPDYINDEAYLMGAYEGLNITEDGYLENAYAIMKGANDTAFLDYRETLDRDEWHADPITVNAYGGSTKNDITFPAAYLQFPLFNVSAPRFQNYGRIGYTIGHEIMHGYDDQGRQYDAEGNLVSWWTDTTLKKFEDGVRCFINQYSKIKYSATGQNINGENTVGENIADNGGLKLAHKAYHLWRNLSLINGTASTEKPTAAELTKYNADQLFFMALAQGRCEVTRPELLRQLILTDEHPPSDVRVNVALQNYAGFAEAYKCPVGSPMNPKEKCSIW